VQHERQINFHHSHLVSIPRNNKNTEGNQKKETHARSLNLLLYTPTSSVPSPSIPRCGRR